LAALVCAGLGISGIIGLLIEPNTYGSDTQTAANRVAIASGFASTGALAATGLRHWQWTRRRPRL